MINFDGFYQQIKDSRLKKWVHLLCIKLDAWNRKNILHTFKNLEKIKTSVKYLPLIIPDILDLKNHVKATNIHNINKNRENNIEKLLRNLMPWRKGPYSLYGIEINSEWRSDWKWERIVPHITPLLNRVVLDVGCGNGYHMWRMIGEGARLVVGIDPMTLFLYQFEAIHKLLGNCKNIKVLPFRLEDLPKLECFDTVFSMGVLYHRYSPFEHLLQLKHQLIKNGELILETLIIDGNEKTILIPHNRYAQMKNVYFIPSVAAIKILLHRCGFIDIRLVNINTTSIQEQRQTDWIDNKSLFDFLDPKDFKKTIEGYPAPKRAIFIARKP